MVCECHSCTNTAVMLKNANLFIFFYFFLSGGIFFDTEKLKKVMRDLNLKGSKDGNTDMTNDRSMPSYNTLWKPTHLKNIQVR